MRSRNSSELRVPKLVKTTMVRKGGPVKGKSRPAEARSAVGAAAKVGASPPRPVVARNQRLRGSNRAERISPRKGAQKR